MKKFRKAQSTLEYVIILAAIIGAIIMVGGLIKNNLKNSYTTLGSTMQTKVGDVKF